MAAGALALAAVGCSGEDRQTVRLFDGSRPARTPAWLARSAWHQHVVVDRVRLGAPSKTEPRLLRACFAQFRGELHPQSVRLVVEGIGVGGRTLTFRDGRNLYGCDTSAGRHERRGLWCGTAFWGFPAGTRRLDPRIDVLCDDAKGKPLGFGWFQPRRDASWLTVDDRAYLEVYPVVSGLPVRLTTHDVRLNASSAVFKIGQYDAEGKELARGTVTAYVAG